MNPAKARSLRTIFDCTWLSHFFFWIWQFLRIVLEFYMICRMSGMIFDELYLETE